MALIIALIVKYKFGEMKVGSFPLGWYQYLVNGWAIIAGVGDTMMIFGKSGVGIIEAVDDPYPTMREKCAL